MSRPGHHTTTVQDICYAQRGLDGSWSDSDQVSGLRGTSFQIETTKKGIVHLVWVEETHAGIRYTRKDLDGTWPCNPFRRTGANGFWANNLCFPQKWHRMGLSGGVSGSGPICVMRTRTRINLEGEDGDRLQGRPPSRPVVSGILAIIR